MPCPEWSGQCSFDCGLFFSGEEGVLDRRHHCPRVHARVLGQLTGGVAYTCRHTPSRKCAFGVQYALGFGTKLGEVPSNVQAVFWGYSAFLDVNVSV